jgi:hypothetical protein
MGNSFLRRKTKEVYVQTSVWLVALNASQLPSKEFLAEAFLSNPIFNESTVTTNKTEVPIFNTYLRNPTCK